MLEQRNNHQWFMFIVHEAKLKSLLTTEKFKNKTKKNKSKS